MYYYERSFLNGKPCYTVIDPDGGLRVFQNEIYASFFVDWLNTIEE